MLKTVSFKNLVQVTFNLKKNNQEEDNKIKVFKKK